MYVIFKDHFALIFVIMMLYQIYNLFWNGQTQCFYEKNSNVIYCLNKNFVNVANYTLKQLYNPLPSTQTHSCTHTPMNRYYVRSRIFSKEGASNPPPPLPLIRKKGP